MPGMFSNDDPQVVLRDRWILTVLINESRDIHDESGGGGKDTRTYTTDTERMCEELWVNFLHISKWLTFSLF